jgi:hypothetical protein
MKKKERMKKIEAYGRFTQVESPGNGVRDVFSQIIGKFYIFYYCKKIMDTLFVFYAFISFLLISLKKKL